VPLDAAARACADMLADIYADAGSWAERRAREHRELDLMLDTHAGTEIVDLDIPAPGGPLTARLYRPTANEALPVVLFIHGGGWVMGSLEICDPFCRALANEAGCAIVSVNYRLAPEDPYPAALDDCTSALAWLCDQSATLNLDTSRLGVAGESAGANLAAALCRRVARSDGPHIAFQALLCPALDASMHTPSVRDIDDRNGITREGLSAAWSAYRAAAPADNPDISPLLDPDVLQLPSAFVLVCECDPLRDEGIEYAARLMRSGTSVSLRCYAGQIHCFFQYDRVLPAAEHARAEIAAELRTALCGST
jgi:acetyl esterase